MAAWSNRSRFALKNLFYQMMTCVGVGFVLYAIVVADDADVPKGYSVLYRTDFAKGIDRGLALHGARSDSLSVVTDPTTESSKVLRATMKRSDDFSRVANKAPRAEVSFGGRMRFEAGKDYWINWSILIPKSYVLDSQQPEGISQIHQGPNMGTPPFGLSLVNGHYQVDLRSGDAGDKPPEHHDIGSVRDDLGKWVKWGLHYRPDPSGRNGISEVYKDGKLVLRRNGTPNAYPNDSQAYFKIGIYKWWWNTKPSDATERTLFFGDVTFSAKK